MTPADPERTRERLSRWYWDRIAEGDRRLDGGSVVMLGCGCVIGALWTIAIVGCIWWARHPHPAP